MRDMQLKIRDDKATLSFQNILQVPITARSLEQCLTDLMTPQPIDGTMCGQCSNVTSEIATRILATSQSIAIQPLRFQQGSEASRNRIKPVVRITGVPSGISRGSKPLSTLNQGHYYAHICRGFADGGSGSLDLPSPF